MNRKDALQIGFIVKTRGVNGELVLEAKESSVLENIKESVHLEIDGLLVPFFITQIHNISSTRVRVTFDWIDNENKAIKLVSCPVFIPTDIVKKSESGTLSPTLLEGFKAIDQTHGEIGIVSQYIEQANNPLLIILKEKTEILIPFQPNLVQEIDTENKILYIDTPEGLVDLYLWKTTNMNPISTGLSIADSSLNLLDRVLEKADKYKQIKQDTTTFLRLLYIEVLGLTLII